MTEGVHSWRVILEDTKGTDTALQEASLQLVGKKVEIQAWYELAEFYQRASELFEQQISMLTAIVIAILLLGIGNTMLMSVIERTGEIGTVMALGRSRLQVLRVFLIEGALMGYFGALLGVACTYVLAAILQLAKIEMPPPPTFARPYMASLHFDVTDVVGIVLIATITTTFAALYPAFRASNMAIVDSLRSAR